MSVNAWQSELRIKALWDSEWQPATQWELSKKKPSLQREKEQLMAFRHLNKCVQLKSWTLYTDGTLLWWMQIQQCKHICVYYIYLVFTGCVAQSAVSEKSDQPAWTAPHFPISLGSSWIPSVLRLNKTFRCCEVEWQPSQKSPASPALVMPGLLQPAVRPQQLC